MILLLEIEFLSGTVFAARGPDSDIPDWPPQPDRVFSALVATWGSRRDPYEHDEEAAALRWLEEQPAPFIAASRAEARTAPSVFVPPNDFATSKSQKLSASLKALKQAASVIPTIRERKERTFPASRPHSPVVLYCWETTTPDVPGFDALQRLAADTAYVGHSSSLTRCRFLRSEALPEVDFKSPIRRTYPGRFHQLRRDYERFRRSNGKIGRPRPGDPVLPKPVLDSPTSHSHFSPEWLVLEHVDGQMPDIRAVALVAKEIRNTLLSGYSKNGMANKIPAEVSGHAGDGTPSGDPHLAVVPLAFAGFPYADGHVLGYALVPPRNSTMLKDGAFRQALRNVLQYHPDAGRTQLCLRSIDLTLSPTLTPSKISLDPARYTLTSSVWATVTPIVLDRHLKRSGAERQEEVEDQIRSACQNIGLPQPERLIADKHPAVEGVPSAQPSGNAPRWMRWRLTPSLANRQLVHAVIRFTMPVEGPLILGAGRFVGLGLCLPINGKEVLS